MSMRVKGIAIATTPMFVEKRFGDLAQANWLAALPAASREILVGPVHVSRWYPLEDALILPTKILCDLHFNGSPKGAWELGRFSADFSLRGIYKVMVRFGSPRWLMGRASRVMKMYYEPSEIRVVENGKTDVSLFIDVFPEPHPLVEQRIGGWAQRALEISGGTSVQVKVISSMTSGAQRTEMRVTWE